MKPRTIAGAVAMAALLFTAAGPRAADLPRADASWAGPYVGLSAGYGRGTADSTAPFNPGPGFFYNFGGDPYSFAAEAEYAYFDFGTVRTSGVSLVGDPYFQTVDVTAHTARIGLNYQF